MQEASELISKLIKTQYPNFTNSNIMFIGEGGDFLAYKVDDLVFRFPKREECDYILMREMAFLDVVSPKLTAPVPKYIYHGKPCEYYPYHFGGYPFMKGERLMDVVPSDKMLDDIALQLGTFLHRLHHIEPASIRIAGIELSVEDDSMEAVRRCALEDLANGCGIIPVEWYDRCCEYFYDKANIPPDYSGAPCIVHTDFGYEHILIDPISNRIIGIIDWSDVAIGDPSWDFARLWAWKGDEFLHNMLDVYQTTDDTLWSRICYRGLATGISFCYDSVNATDHHEYQKSGLAFLERIFNNGV